MPLIPWPQRPALAVLPESDVVERSIKEFPQRYLLDTAKNRLLQQEDPLKVSWYRWFQGVLTGLLYTSLQKIRWLSKTPRVGPVGLWLLLCG